MDKWELLSNVVYGAIRQGEHMKICFLAPANSIHSYRWVKYFADKGHAVHWISFYPSSFSSIDNVRYYEISTKRAKTFHAIIQTKKLIKKIKPDILHVHSVALYGIAGALSRFHPVVATAWGSDVLITGKSWIKAPFVKYALNKADLITCDASHMIDAMIALGADDKKIRLIYFGIDTDRFCPEEKNRELREQLGIGDCPAVISLRSLSPVYNVETLVRAVPYVLKEVSDAKFVIVGIGPEERILRALAMSLGVSENVRFVGRIPNEKLPEYLASMDIYVSTALSDAGIAASTAEAMACGLPVVITDSGENRKWLKDGEEGFIVPVKCPEVLAEKIIYLLKDKDVRAEFGKRGRKIIEVRNNYYVEMEKMENIYMELIERNE